MKKLFKIEKEGEGTFNLLTASSNRHLGNLIADVDGYYYFWDFEPTGSWSAHHLREIADILDGLNKEWDEKVSKDTAI